MISKRHIRTIVTTVIVVALVAGGTLIFRGTDFSFLRRLTARSLMYIVPLFLLYQAAAVAAHSILLRTMGHPVSIPQLTVILFASYASNLAGLAKVGVPVRIYLLRQMSRVPVAIGTSASAVLYFVELAITIIIALVGFSYFVPETTARNTAWLVILILLVVALAAFFHLRRPRETRLKGAGRRIADFLVQVQDGMRKTTVATFAGLVSLALGKRVTLAVTSYIILKELGTYLPLKGLIFLQSSAILVGFISMVPFGLGTRDVTTFLLYERLGMRPEVSAAMTAIERTIWTLVPFCFGVISAALIGASRRFSSQPEGGQLP